MEVYQDPILREDRQMLLFTHLSQLLNLFTGFGGFIVPLIIWLTQKDKIEDMDKQGKQILNFQLTMLLAALVAVPLMLILIGFVIIAAVGLLTLIFPIINAIKANNGEPTHYPLSIEFFK
ncbi:DUF4870 domain-containing protein [Psychroflexus sp. CAK57W]|uniref:DUF4870 domain-containing protein n=1 Tax=Psychroflexus curvus TaxID=2873595 RepID=UPI001CCDAAC3|nr:DUF4870 domain-containing protein [Psychroflexus curvus]MBZ9626669.1 DUF4870 domain-containing protein [Psychroflexus curvus]MBZ9786445.1 DUF4870 domain-containing protein [Psychroflexus curvus]